MAHIFIVFVCIAGNSCHYYDKLSGPNNKNSITGLEPRITVMWAYLNQLNKNELEKINAW